MTRFFILRASMGQRLVVGCVLAISTLAGCSQISAPPLPLVSPPPGPPPNAAQIQYNLRTMPDQWNQSFFATLKINHRNMAFIGQMHLTRTAAFQITGVSELGSLLFEVHGNPHGVHLAHLAPGLPRQWVINVSQDIIIALLKPQHQNNLVVHISPTDHKTTVIFTDILGNRHACTFFGPGGRLRQAAITLKHHQHLQVLYARYNTSGIPIKLFLRQPAQGWLLILNLTGTP